MSRGQPRRRSQTTRRVLERCQNKSNIGDAIVIDDDSENADVVLVDGPSTSNVGSTNANTTKLSCLPRSVIYIDDEEEEVSNLSGDPASNQFDETFNSSSLSEDPDSDDCVMFLGNGHVRCDRSGPSKNRFGLYVDSENSTTESSNLKSETYDCDECEDSSSDCEIIEDHSGNIRKQWERAASKKEGGPFTSDQATSSTIVYPEGPSHEPILQNSDVGNCFENIPCNHLEEMLAEFDLRRPNNGEQSPSVTIHSVDESACFCERTTYNVLVSPSCLNNHIPFEEPGNWWKDDDSNLSEFPEAAHSKDDGLSLNEDPQEPVKNSFFTYQNHGKARFYSKEEASTETSCDSPTLDMKQVLKASDNFQERVEEKVKFSGNRQSNSEMVAEQEVEFKEKKIENSADSSLLCGQQVEETLFHAEDSTDSDKMDGNVNNNIGQIETNDVWPTSHNESDSPNCYENLIGERERHKKTDQYKRVEEEEWASRQQQLLIQAEEVQKLRKRRKVEKIRLLDMERRQKQRLQEIRDLNKKDEETTLLKERIRAEVRRDLERVEMNCRDMASVLRVLGIHVKGGAIPMEHEVNTAYKQALVRFHPDRAPRTDARQQVEAEEKFKLVSRLKEQLLF